MFKYFISTLGYSLLYLLSLKLQAHETGTIYKAILNTVDPL